MFGTTLANQFRRAARERRLKGVRVMALGRSESERWHGSKALIVWTTAALTAWALIALVLTAF